MDVRMDVRTLCENSDHYRPGLWSALWINTAWVLTLLFSLRLEKKKLQDIHLWHQWSSWPDPQSSKLTPLFLLESCFVSQDLEKWGRTYGQRQMWSLPAVVIVVGLVDQYRLWHGRNLMTSFDYDFSVSTYRYFLLHRYCNFFCYLQHFRDWTHLAFFTGLLLVIYDLTIWQYFLRRKKYDIPWCDVKRGLWKCWDK